MDLPVTLTIFDSFFHVYVEGRPKKIPYTKF